ncbi:MAG: N-formylglutamate amidohydrolase [Flavobacteriales bacterium]|nr:N-formylglutamate amidohydrolase [Flavobacteriales bacterium]
MTSTTAATYTEGPSALLVTAIHAGKAMRPSLKALCKLDEVERLREEDPFTDRWTDIAENTIVGLRSRFEVDLNRPRAKAVYRMPTDCWGLDVWEGTMPTIEVERSLATYDAFYESTGALVERLLSMHERLMVYDLHSYNHQRRGPGLLDDAALNPEINLGTANVDHDTWGDVLDVLTAALLTGPDGRSYDVRENVKFKGGHFGCWLNERFGARVCPVAIEFRKDFMNEWTGEPDAEAIARIHALLTSTIAPVMQATKLMQHA